MIFKETLNIYFYVFPISKFCIMGLKYLMDSIINNLLIIRDIGIGDKLWVKYYLLLITNISLFIFFTIIQKLVTQSIDLI